MNRTMKHKKITQVPEIGDLKAELKREKYKHRYASVLRSTVFTLVVVAAFAILVATLWMPVLQIYGTSMTPTLDEGQIVVSVKGYEFEPGDLVAFYIGNGMVVEARGRAYGVVYREVPNISKIVLVCRVRY